MAQDMGDGIIVFTDMREALDFMVTEEMSANDSLTPGQILLRDDVATTRYWVQALPDYDLVIYGRADTVADLVATDPGFDPKVNRERGYLTGRFYSADDPSGDPHDVHVSEVVPINVDIFNAAQERGWPRWSDLPEHMDLARALAICERMSTIGIAV